MTQPTDLRPIAHAALSLTEPPYLKHYPRGRFATWKHVAFTTSSLPGAGFNFASVLRPDVPPLDDIVAHAREYFAHCAHAWGVLVEGDAGHPMEAELRDRGWKVDEDEPAFVLPVLAPTIEVAPAAGIVIRVAVGAEEAQNFHDLVGRAFGAPPEMAAMMQPLPSLANDPDIALFLGSIDGADVCAAGFSRSGPTAVLWGVATLEEHRGRGYGEAVCRAALTHAANRGCVHAALRSGPKSVPLYERLGFRYACQHRTYAYPGP